MDALLMVLVPIKQTSHWISGSISFWIKALSFYWHQPTVSQDCIFNLNYLNQCRLWAPECQEMVWWLLKGCSTFPYRQQELWLLKVQEPARQQCFMGTSAAYLGPDSSYCVVDAEVEKFGGFPLWSFPQIFVLESKTCLPEQEQVWL